MANGHVIRFKYEDYLDVHDMVYNGVDEHIILQGLDSGINIIALSKGMLDNNIQQKNQI